MFLPVPTEFLNLRAQLIFWLSVMLKVLSSWDNSACISDWNQSILGQVTQILFMKCTFQHLCLFLSKSSTIYLHVLSCLSWDVRRDTAT